MRFNGHLDLCNSNEIAGWAFNKSRPNQTVWVDVYDFERRIATIPANVFREDLLQSRIGNGYHGFTFKFPEDMKDNKDHLISVKYTSTEFHLTGSPQKIKGSLRSETKISLYDGNFDECGPDHLFGWAFNKSQTHKIVKIDIYDFDQLIATIPANVFREDLLRHGIGNGYHGFLFDIPQHLKDNKDHLISLKIADTNIHLNGSPQKISYSISKVHNEIRPIYPRESGFEGKRLNLLVPSINQAHIYGGISTALKLFTKLTDSSLSKRIILTDASPGLEDLKRFPSYKHVSPIQDSVDRYQIVSLNDRRHNKTLPIAKGDIFLPTAWWTAYLAQNLVKWQSNVYKIDMTTILYLIQDYEPAFYPWSSKYVFAEKTYKFNGNQIGIFNTSLLRDYFFSLGYRFEKSYTFEPKMDPTLKSYMKQLKSIKKKKQIIIYGRPSVERNAFDLIIAGLQNWVMSYPNIGEWEIVSVGEQHSSIYLGNGKEVKSKGKLSLENYAEILSESAVGISLMVSPHPSYPPLEMAHFGILTITNHFANKDISSWHENITSLSDLSAENLSEKLGDLCRKFELDNKLGITGASNVNFYFDNSEQFPFYRDILNYLLN